MLSASCRFYCIFTYTYETTKLSSSILTDDATRVNFTLRKALINLQDVVITARAFATGNEGKAYRCDEWKWSRRLAPPRIFFLSSIRLGNLKLDPGDDTYKWRLDVERN